VRVDQVDLILNRYRKPCVMASIENDMRRAQRNREEKILIMNLEKIDRQGELELKEKELQKIKSYGDGTIESRLAWMNENKQREIDRIDAQLQELKQKRAEKEKNEDEKEEKYSFNLTRISI